LSEFQNEYTWGNAVENNSTEKFQEDFDKAIDKVRKNLGKKYPIIINGQEIYYDDCFTVRSPADTGIIMAEFPKTSTDDTENAISSAKNSFEKWSRTTYQKRVQIFRNCADVFSRQKFFLAALMTFENGKNRLEATGDVDETIDFMRFYALQLEKNQGFCKQTIHPNPHEKTQIVMKPYGV